MPLTNEKIAEIQTIVKLVTEGQSPTQERITRVYDDYLLALEDPAALEKKQEERSEAMAERWNRMKS